MNKYVINYGFGTARFYTDATDPKQVQREFYSCANQCFGIRKSMSGYEVVVTHLNVELPEPYRGYDATHFLSHSGDDILFDWQFEAAPGYGWKIHNESGEWCSCAVRGKPELSCEVHHFWVPDHDTLCDCSKRN